MYPEFSILRYEAGEISKVELMMDLEDYPFAAEAPASVDHTDMANYDVTNGPGEWGHVVAACKRGAISSEEYDRLAEKVWSKRG